MADPGKLTSVIGMNKYKDKIIVNVYMYVDLLTPKIILIIISFKVAHLIPFSYCTILLIT